MAKRADPAVATLAESLEQRTREGILYERLPESAGCAASPAATAASCCRVSQASAGPREPGRPPARAARVRRRACQLDPIEKKPFFHAFPGRAALSFGMLGCDLHCGYCQNWLTVPGAPRSRVRSRSERRRAGRPGRGRRVARCPRHGHHLQRAAHHRGVGRESSAPRRRRGITCGFVSNGNGTPRRCSRILRPFVDLYKVDLKGFEDAHYRELGGEAGERPRTRSHGLHAMGFWVEIVHAPRSRVQRRPRGAARPRALPRVRVPRTSPGT
jgi:pyruvate formate lyase activating enzyme